MKPSSIKRSQSGFEDVELEQEGKSSSMSHRVSFKGESSFSIAKRKCRKVVENITLEPVLFFVSFVGNLDSASLGQLVIDKSCRLDFNFGPEVCDNLLNETYTAENKMVQDEVAQFKVYESIVDHLFPIICSFFLGSWSDTFGRKLLLYIFFAARILDGSLMMLNAYFMDWPKEYLLFTVNLPVALSGGQLAFSMGLNAFISDISTPEQRSFRLAMMHFVSSIGRPVGTILGAYLFKQGSYVCVIGATLLGRVLGAAFLVIRLEMFKWRPQNANANDTSASGGQPKKHSAFSPAHIVDSMKTLFKRRPNQKRTFLFIYLSCMLVVVLPFFGEYTIGYNYVRTRFQWDIVEYSKFRTITEVVDIVGQAVFIPLLGYLQIPDCIIIPVLLFLVFARHVIRGLALEPWLLYLASAVDMMGGYSFSATRSIISKCVERQELGKVFAILASLESLVPIGMSQVYASLWKATSGLGPYLVGSCYFFSAALTLIAVILSFTGMLLLRGSDLSDRDPNEPTFRPSYRMTEREFLTRWYAPPFRAMDQRDNGDGDHSDHMDGNKGDQVGDAPYVISEKVEVDMKQEQLSEPAYS